jgi:Mg2+ and Co2+ transporter CorA
MTYQDTAFDRQHVRSMTHDELLQHVTRVRERRMSAVRLYEQAKLAKSKAKEAKDIETYEKRLDQICNVLERIDKAFGTLDKYVAEVQLLRLTLGDDITNNQTLKGE